MVRPFRASGKFGQTSCMRSGIDQSFYRRDWLDFLSDSIRFVTPTMGWMAFAGIGQIVKLIRFVSVQGGIGPTFSGYPVGLIRLPIAIQDCSDL